MLMKQRTKWLFNILCSIDFSKTETEFSVLSLELEIGAWGLARLGSVSPAQFLQTDCHQSCQHDCACVVPQNRLWPQLYSRVSGGWQQSQVLDTQRSWGAAQKLGHRSWAPVPLEPRMSVFIKSAISGQSALSVLIGSLLWCSGMRHGSIWARAWPPRSRKLLLQFLCCSIKMTNPRGHCRCWAN